MNLSENIIRIKNIISFLNEEMNSEPEIIFIGGLESKKSLQTQTSILNSGFSSQKKIKSYSYSTNTKIILDELKKFPHRPIFLFSAGCAKSSEIASSPYISKSKMFIIEPYALGPNTTKSVKDAVRLGVPSKNVITSCKHQGRGAGVLGDVGQPTCTKDYTNDFSENHFNSLEFTAKLSGI